MNAQARTNAPLQTAAISNIANGVLQRQCACGTHTVAGGECETCQKKKVSNRLQSAANTEHLHEVPPIVYAVLRSPGQSLDAGTRSFFESRFNHDFSHVRVHTDVKAAESARAVNARAYTVGRSVIFGEGQYVPEQTQGQRLLAHELTHVLQQESANPSLRRPLRVSTAADAAEREADHVAVQVMAASKTPKETLKTTPSGQVSVSGFTSGPVTLSRKSASESHEPLPELERGVASNESEVSPMDSDSGAPAPAACVAPKSVALGDIHTLDFPDYLTGGGICAVMQVDPAVNNLCAGIAEEITLAPKPTCPDSLIKGGLCQGSSTFPLGKAQGGACSAIKPKATEFVDRHSVQLSSTSVLHDSGRNPKGLKSCQYTCHQRYFIQTGATQVNLGQFQIHYELSKGMRDGKEITKVTTTKTTKK